MIHPAFLGTPLDQNKVHVPQILPFHSNTISTETELLQEFQQNRNFLDSERLKYRFEKKIAGYPWKIYLGGYYRANRYNHMLSISVSWLTAGVRYLDLISRQTSNNNVHVQTASFTFMDQGLLTS